MESVAGVLDHLGGTQRDQAGFDTKAGVDIRNFFDGVDIASAHHHQRRLHEIVDRDPFPEELRIRHYLNIRMGAQDRQDHLFAGAGENCAADGNDQRLRSSWQVFGHFADDAAQLIQTQVAVFLGRRTDANQRDIGLP